MGPRLVGGVGLALAVSWAVGCGPEPRAITPTGAPRVIDILPASSSPAPARSAESGDGAPGLAASFACGGSRCQVGKESCCRLGERATCVSNAPPEPPASGQLLGSQIQLCQGLPDQAEVDEIARCRSSAHCLAHELCCDEFLFSGASALICKAAEQSQLSCSYGEVCTKSLPCRDPSAVCAQGKCRKRAEMPCGQTTCNLTTHCCVVADPATGRLECVPEAQGEAWRAQGRPIIDIACARHADCQAGELCRTALGRAFCQRADDGMSAVVCDKPSDCPKSICALAPHGKTVACHRKPGDWQGICDCL